MGELRFKDIRSIGVISDTHIPAMAEKIPEKVFEIFKGADLILHAGDLVEPRVVEELKKIAPVVAVKGNMDKFDDGFPEKVVILINGRFKIGLFHGEGSPLELEERIITYFKDVDCIVFGHSHHMFNEIREGVLLFNPGSACDTTFTDINSIGILHINEKIRGEIFKI
ncbi:metallophosphatase family protein [Candidatus Woesearchaeota archaeon]|nr:metallophosphatase family protein [Candidatus Woesearchaeota archaeon]